MTTAASKRSFDALQMRKNWLCVLFAQRKEFTIGIRYPTLGSWNILSYRKSPFGPKILLVSMALLWRSGKQFVKKNPFWGETSTPSESSSRKRNVQKQQLSYDEQLSVVIVWKGSHSKFCPSCWHQFMSWKLDGWMSSVGGQIRGE